MLDPKRIQTYAGILILVAIAAVCLGIVVYDEVRDVSPDSVIQNLVVFITGVVASLVGVHIGNTSQQDAYKNGTNTGMDIMRQARRDENNSPSPHVPDAPRP